MGGTRIEGDVIHVTHPHELAAGIKQYRAEREQILAQTAQESGRSLRHINRMETRKVAVNPKLDTLLDLSRALNVAFVIDGRGTADASKLDPLTPGQVRVLRAICNHLRRHDSSPSVSDLEFVLRINRSAVHKHLQHLISKGYIDRQGDHGTIRVLVRPKGGDSSDG